MGIILSIIFGIVTIFNAKTRWKYLPFVAYLFGGILATSILRKNYCRGGGLVVLPCPKLSILSQSNIVRLKKALGREGVQVGQVQGLRSNQGWLLVRKHMEEPHENQNMPIRQQLGILLV